MKWILLSVALVARVMAQDYSCVDIAKMDEAKFRQILSALKQNVVVKDINPKEIRKETGYVNRYYNQTKEYKKCFALRDIYTKSVENLDRAVGLGILSKMALNAQENRIYKQRLLENEKYFSVMSGASYVNNRACSYKLIYLNAGYSKNGQAIVYEKRIVRGKVKSLKFVKSIDVLKPMCGKGKALQQYTAYLNKKGLDVGWQEDKIKDDLQDGINIEPENNIGEDIYHPILKKVPKLKQPKVYIVSNKFMTISSLKAVKVSNSRSIVIKKGKYLIYFKTNKEEVFFKFNNSTYRAIKEHWYKHTKRINND